MIDILIFSIAAVSITIALVAALTIILRKLGVRDDD